MDNFSSVPGEGKTIEELDIQGYQEQLNYALRSLSGKYSGRYYLCYYRVLDHVVPYATQAPIAMIADIEGKLINNLSSSV